MQKRLIIFAAAIVIVGFGGCGSQAGPTATAAPTTSLSSLLTTSTTALSATTATTVRGKSLPISVSAELSSPGQDPSILIPSACHYQNGSLEAHGTFQGNFAQEVYVRYGDVAELYAFAAPADGNAQGVQVAELSAEQPYRLEGKGPWKVTVPVDSKLGTPVKCVIAVQSTHAFMAAGSAGG